jgi:sulfatase maturation enzyme AslB (radical SAM superfamily)
MANIMVTEKCNFSCPYCFADEFVNKLYDEISIENFQKALDFVLSSKSSSKFIGIIGGEPTLHSRFAELLTIINRNDHIREALIFTNGLKIEETSKLTSNQKFTFLINLNSPEIIGYPNYSHIIENIDILISKYNKKRSITLGLNIYKYDMDYDYFIKILQKYRFRSARVSITVPNLGVKKRGVERLAAFKNIIYKVYIDLMYQGINVVFDCNKMPLCLWNEEEVKKISLFQANNDNERFGFNLDFCKCNPVIDILPDLTAIRCFGLSKFSRVKIEDFQSLDELSNYYRANFDDKLSKIPTMVKCRNCEKFIDNTCYSGCLLNKIRID